MFIVGNVWTNVNARHLSWHDSTCFENRHNISRAISISYLRKSFLFVAVLRIEDPKRKIEDYGSDFNMKISTNHLKPLKSKNRRSLWLQRWHLKAVSICLRAGVYRVIDIGWHCFFYKIWCMFRSDNGYLDHRQTIYDACWLCLILRENI